MRIGGEGSSGKMGMPVGYHGTGREFLVGIRKPGRYHFSNTSVFKAIYGSNSSGRKMAPMELGCIGTAVPGEGAGLIGLSQVPGKVGSYPQ